MTVNKTPLLQLEVGILFSKEAFVYFGFNMYNLHNVLVQYSYISNLLIHIWGFIMIPIMRSRENLLDIRENSIL